ncbi:MAG: hypothetical protein K0Q94_562 [Paenibacillus sp.]|jgi:hypothetical protein|nr:hypothetical protein [Paenibacillus sp.]
MPITDYGQYMQEPTGKGRIALYPDYHADTLAAAGTIGWGRAVQYSATNKNRGELYTGARKAIGVAIANHYAEYRSTNVSNDIVGEYVANDAVSVMRSGFIWVTVLEDVEKGETAVVDNATGDFRPSDTATATKSAVIGEFKTSALANGLAMLELKIPAGGA